MCVSVRERQREAERRGDEALKEAEVSQLHREGVGV